MQASRLRSRLQEYYETEGVDDDIRIRLTKLSYVAAFERAAGAPTLPALAVLPLQNFTGDESLDYVSDGLTEEVINLLARVEGLRVVAGESGHRHLEVAGRAGADSFRLGRQVRHGNTFARFSGPWRIAEDGVLEMTTYTLNLTQQRMDTETRR